MKNICKLWILWVLTLSVTACQKEYESVFAEKFETVTFSFDFQPSTYFYNGSFENTTFKLGGDYKNSDIAIPETLLDANGIATGTVVFCPADMHFSPIGDPVSFNVSLKQDTTLFFRQAINDPVRQIPERFALEALDGTRYAKINFESVYSPANAILYTIMFDDRVYDIANSKVIWLNKEKMKSTLRFYNYQENVLHLDTVRLKPELTLKNYAFTENEPFRYIRPLGSPIELYRDENADEYTTFSARVMYGTSDSVTFFYTYGGDQLTNYKDRVRKDNLHDTLKIFKQNKIIIDPWTFRYDTTLVFTDSRQFQPEEKIEFVYMNGQLGPNDYTGEDPSDRASFFVRVSAVKDAIYYDENFNTQVYSGNYDIKVSMAYYDMMNGTYSNHKLLREFKNIEGGVFSEPFEVHVRGDIVPEDLYDAKVASGEALLVYDIETYEDTEEWKRCRGVLVVEVYGAGTNTLYFTNNNTPIDLLNNFETEAFRMNDDWSGFFLPAAFIHKCFYVEQGMWSLGTVLKQGVWE